jgi:predicted short-subunit dehydrogenase-like oxidoreductase (DUF2520 family)
MTDNLSNITIGIVGNGKVGSVLARSFTSAGYPISCVVAIDSSSRALDSKIPVLGSIEQIPSGIKCLLMCVPDNEIRNVIEELLRLRKIEKGMVVGHTAGAESAEILAALRDHGATVMAWHPMQTFTGEEGAELLKGVTIGIDGDPEAVAIGKQIAKRIGSEPYCVPPEMRPLYHLGGVFACNFMSALTAISADLLTEVGMERNRAFQTLAPLLERTIQNINSLGLPDAITGPVSRGDTETISKHEEVLEDHPKALEVYRLLSGVLKKEIEGKI